MITACDTQDFVPAGRDYAHHHPGKFQIQVQNVVHTDPGLPLLKSFKDISIQDNSKKEQWTFYTHKDREHGTFDEELYVSGNTVIWSRGGQDGCRAVMRTFTMDTPVIQALWCTFVIPETSNIDKIGPSLDVAGTEESGVCVVEANCVTCFMENGNGYPAALPFQVAHVWAIQNGLLFERTVSPAEFSSSKRNAPNQTTVFSMLHPLDEVAPVITQTGSAGCQKTSYLTDNTQHIVFSSIDPSLVLTYDTMVGVHSAWKVRRAKTEEINNVSNTWDQTTSLYQMGPNTPAHNLSQSSNFSLVFGNMSAAASPQVSPLRSFSGRLSSPAFMSRSQSPLVVLQPGLDRRSQSPGAIGYAGGHRFYTPSPSAANSPANFYRTPANMSLINDSSLEWVEPITPEVCLEHIWTEPAPAIRDGSLGKSSKAFLTRDMCGQQYLCYLINYRQQLRCVKFEDSNDLKRLVFGTVAVIPCKDAVPIEGKDLLVVLDTTGSLFVYSGPCRINRFHVPALPMGNGSISMMRMTPMHSPVRGGVFTSSRPPSAMDACFDEEFQLNQISPVATELEESTNMDDLPLGCGFVQSLRDNVYNRFTIELTNGHLFRVSLPELTTLPGLELCLAALKHVLPKDLALQMLGKWYTVRNSPGLVGSQSEWTVFRECLLGMMGYDTENLTLTSKNSADVSVSPVSAKRVKTDNQGSDEDWEWLLGSDHHGLVSQCTDDVLGLPPCSPLPDTSHSLQQGTITTTAMLFQYIPACFMALHLVYEELKLSTLLLEDLGQLSQLLLQLAVDLKCDQYIDYYNRDFPDLWKAVDSRSQIKPEHLEKMQYPSVFSKHVMSVYNWIIRNLEGQEMGALAYIPNVCTKIQNVISLYALLINKHLGTEQAIDKCLKKVPSAGHRAPTCDISMSKSFGRSSPTQNYLERVVLYMTQLGMMERDLISLPVGVALPIREAIFHCRCNPPADWPEEAYLLIGRQDISKLMSLHEAGDEVAPPPGIYKRKPSPQSQGTREEEDGMEHLDDEYLRLRFSEDLRIQEVRRLLQSSRPARIALEQKPEISDHDFMEEQERHLYAICIRTMALPIGRGMFTLSTYHPLPTETLPIPKLCLTGKAPPRNTTVDLSHIDTPPNMTSWPLFHNGVAAGLRIADCSQVDTSWIIYNRPKSNGLNCEYAGFLMAVGLNNHLGKMQSLEKHDYLIKLHEMTTIGLLLGVAGAKRGTMDLATMKMLSIHLPAMLPPTSTELNVTHNVQVAAILGVGLMFQGTGHRHTADILLAEIGRPPGPEMENCTDRESYSLAAGLALGLVMLGKGKETVGTSDLSMADTLYHFMVGGHKRPLIGHNKERYKTPSYQIQEGDSVNVDVTAPGATLALGMLFFNTQNSAVSEWLKIPDTQFMLDQVRPDFLLLRTIARGLVMWDNILPTFSYLQSNIPQILKDYAFQKGGEQQDEENSIDYETMSQAYCNVLAGACMVVGLKFAGSANQVAFNTQMECLKRALKVMSTAVLVEQAGKSTVENCMMTILLSMALVMAGTGNLEVLRLCRMFRSRVGPPYSTYVTYGSHMAISMAVGLLFLGGGKYTMSTSKESVAVMLCAFYPKFPTHSNDNRYHLQAFRHLYVLAAELRTMLPRDVDTGHPCYVPLEIKFRDSAHYQDQAYTTRAPCILPDLEYLQEIRILGPRYWPIIFNKDTNWSSLKIVADTLFYGIPQANRVDSDETAPTGAVSSGSTLFANTSNHVTMRLLLKHNGTLYVKQRAGHLSYVEDPKGYRSMLAKSLTADHSSQTGVKPDVIKAFTSDAKVLALTENFLGSKTDELEDLLQVLSDILYECVTMDKPEAIASHICMDQVLRRSDFQLSSLGVCQMKLIYAYYNLEHATTLGLRPGAGLGAGEGHASQRLARPDSKLVKPEFILSTKNRLKSVFDKKLNDNLPLLTRYVKGESLGGQDTSYLSAFLLWYDIPSPAQLGHLSVDGVPSLPSLHTAMPQLHVSTLMKLLKVWQAGAT